MTLQNSNLKLRPSVLVSDTVPAQNGGRMAYSEVVSGVKNNLLPDATAAQRLNGLVRWRKVFWHVDSADTVALNNVMIYMDKQTQGDDYLLFQGDNVTANGTEDEQDEGLLYGIGLLCNDASAGDDTVTVTCEHADYANFPYPPFRPGMTIRISNIPPGGGAGTEDFVVLTAVEFDGDTATLTFAGSVLVEDYLSDETIVSAVFTIDTVAGSFDSLSTNTAHGTIFQAVPGNISVPSLGSIDESWTITFTDANTFTVAGATVGALSGTGSVSAYYEAINPATSTPYFSIQAATWAESFMAGETVTFNTSQASLPLLVRQCIPAGSGSLAGNVGAIAIRGESA